MTRAFLIILVAAIILAAFAFVQKSVPVLDENLRSYKVVPSFLYPPEKVPIDTNATIVSLSDMFAINLVDSNALRLQDSIMQVLNYNGKKTGLIAFFNSLHQSKTGNNQTRIGFFGDSMVEGDLITQSLRDKLQKEFGGSGVGWVPITSIVANFRRTVKHSFSGNWVYSSFVKGNSTPFKYGISGEVFTVWQDSSGAQPATVSYKTTSAFNHSTVFPNVNLYYGAAKVDSGQANNNQLIANVDGNGSTYALDGTDFVNQLTLASGGSYEVQLEFDIDDNIPIYGMSMNTKSGVVLDNIAMRGSSGLPYTGVPSYMMSGFNSYMNYDLIVVQYGLNVIPTGTTDVGWYEDGFKRVVNYFKTTFPNASILVIGVPDKGIKKDGQMVTDPVVKQLTDIQRRVSLETEVAFLNLYEAMGGEGSMVEWATSDPPKANLDYTHFNGTGAMQVANMIYDFLIEEYYTYEKDSLAAL